MEFVLKAVKTFVCTKSSNKEVREADKFLKELERSKESWQLVIQALEVDGLQQDEYFLLAKILKSKLEYDFGQLSEEHAASLPAKIMQLLTRFKEAQLIVQAQLVDCFIFCYLHMFDRWPDLLSFIKDNFSSDQKMQNYIFLIYEYLPDSVFSKTIVMDEQHQDKMINYFKDNLQKRIIEELDVFARNATLDRETQYRLLKILSNWIDFKTNSQILSTLHSHSIFQLALSSMNSVQLQEFSAATIVGALRQLKKREEQESHKELFQLIAAHVFGYFSSCHTAYLNCDYESVRIYSKVFLKFGSRALSQFTTTATLFDEASQQFLLNMLEVTKYENIDNEEETSSFWEAFCNNILSIQCASQREVLVSQYARLLEQLLNICIEKVTFPADIFELHQTNTPIQISKIGDDFENRNNQRQKMKSLFGAISKIIGTEQIITFSINAIKQLNLIVQFSELQIEQARKIEGIFYCLHEVVLLSQRTKKCESGSSDQGFNPDNPTQQQNSKEMLLTPTSIGFVFEILNASLQSHSSWIRLQRSLLQIVIACSDFLQENLSVCELAFKLIIPSLKVELLNSIAQTGFEVLCKDCPLFVQTNIDSFLQNVYSSQMFNYQILAGISYAICATDEYLRLHFISLCSPYAKDLINFTNLSQEQQANSEISKELKRPLKALKCIISCVPERQQAGAFPHDILQEIFKQIWPVLKFIMETQSGEVSLVETIITVLKNFIIKLNVDFDIFLEDFLKQIVLLYRHTKLSGILYVVEKSIKIFAVNAKHVGIIGPILKEAFEALVETTLAHIPTLHEFTENPDLIEDYFGFLARFIKYFPQIFFSSSFVLQIVNSASTGIPLQHKEAAVTLFQFLEIFYLILSPRFDRKADVVRNEIEEIKKILAHSATYSINVLLFQELQNVPQREIRSVIIDVLLAQVKVYGSQAVPFFQPIVVNLSEDILTITEKEKLIKLIIAATPDSMDKKIECALLSSFALIADRFKKSFRRNY